jgi:hypothetical protein
VTDEQRRKTTFPAPGDKLSVGFTELGSESFKDSLNIGQEMEPGSLFYSGLRVFLR